MNSFIGSQKFSMRRQRYIIFFAPAANAELGCFLLLRSREQTIDVCTARMWDFLLHSDVAPVTDFWCMPVDVDIAGELVYVLDSLNVVG